MKFKLALAILTFIFAFALVFAPSHAQQGGVGPGPGTAHSTGTATPTPTPTPSFPVNGILDAFNRTNEGPPPSASWGGIIWTGNGCAVNTNQLKCATNGTAYWGTSFGPGTEAYLTSVNVGTWSGSWAVLACISTPGGASENGYMVIANESTDAVLIQRIDADTATTLGAGLTQPFFNGDSIGIKVSSGTVTAYYCASGTGCGVSGAGWTVIGSRSDSTYTTGYIGVFSTNSSATMDNFGGGTH